jgi:hypothetical protein
VVTTSYRARIIIYRPVFELFTPGPQGWPGVKGLEPKIVHFRARGLPPFRAARMPFLATRAVRIVREVAEIVRDRSEIEWRLISARFDQPLPRS